MDTYDILVILLSVLLIIFLSISIVIAIYIMKFVKTLQQMTDKAKDLVDNASSVAATMKKAAAPTVVAKFIAEQVSNAVKKHSKDSRKEK